jgi:hypothetical protein
MKLKKQTAALLLTAGIAALCLTACGTKTEVNVSTDAETTAEETSGQSEEETAKPEEVVLPKKGDTINGFTVDEVTQSTALDADVLMLTHEKTGAQVIYIANDDTNRAFDIAFRTPASDTGIAHVFEHSCLTGSQKYPADMFFALNAQTHYELHHLSAFRCFGRAAFEDGGFLSGGGLSSVNLNKTGKIQPGILAV